MKNTRKIIVALLVLVTMLMSMTAIVASADGEEAPKIGEFWASNDALYTVTGTNPVNIKYNGVGNSYACVGADIAGLAAGNDTFTATVTNNGSADSRVRFDIQGTNWVSTAEASGNPDSGHNCCNVSATGGDIWNDPNWGGATLTVPAGQSVDITIIYDENTARGAITNLVVFVDAGRGDANTYNSDVTVSNITFSNSKAPAEPKPEAPKTHVLESKDFETFESTEDNHRVVMNDYFTVIFKKDGKVDDADEVTFADGYKVGETAIAIGNPEGEGISVTEGIVSVDHEYIALSIDGMTRNYRVMRIDTAIYGGSSGGGLFDGEGKLIGITNAGDGEDQNVNYAVPVQLVESAVKNIMHYSASGEKNAKKVKLGIEVTKGDAKFVYSEQDGYGKIVESITISNLEEGFIGESIGFALGDEVKAIIVDGVEMELNRIFEVGDILFTVFEGSKINFKVVRGGNEITLTEYTVLSGDITQTV